MLALAHSKRAQTLAEACLLKRGRGRERALRHLVELLAPAARLRITEKDCLGFLYLRPGGRIVLSDDPDDPGLSQDGIAARLLLLRADRVTAVHGHLEFSDHCIGRLLERSPKADPAAVMVAAHDQALKIAEFADEFWLPAGAWGAFACQSLLGCAEDEPDKLVRHLRCRTWLDADMR